MTRLLMLTERFPPDLGGLARSAARLAGSLARVGAEVDVLAWTKTLPPGALETVDAGAVHPEAAGATLHRLGLYASQDFSLQHTFNVLEWLHAQRAFEAVWGHYATTPGFAAVLFAEQQGLPSTVSARGNDIDRAVFPPGDFARLQWTLQRARIVTCVSQAMARKVTAILGSDAQLEVVPNTVDAETFAPGPPPAGLRERLGIRPGEAVLAFAGELRQKKGFPFLLEALCAVQRERPACLLVIGEVRPSDRAKLATFAADFPEAAARIVISGQLDAPAEVAAHLRLADVFLHPSLWDGLPNALLESMACGLPVLASDAGGIPEAIEHGVSGFVIGRHELHRLGEGTLELLALAPEQRAAIGAAARARVLERFHPAAEEASLRAVLQRLSSPA
ncbi:MAG: glycosyltransferase [Planctomycetes bacterium]|nr:glycosyltransferase [Planctomycetota bacterium]